MMFTWQREERIRIDRVLLSVRFDCVNKVNNILSQIIEHLNIVIYGRLPCGLFSLRLILLNIANFLEASHHKL